ncbi:hypothetical protein [Planctomicrobium sp. SH664]|uniref:hypothetical protein n=1 Tax=Planctomicrobium sp. SH664 TaxID=3448125 RepID=UPI003F5B379D
MKELLAPFQSNNDQECPREYLVFEDQEDSFRSEYETESVDMVVTGDGRLLMAFDKEFQLPGAWGNGQLQVQVPEHLARSAVPHKERFATFEAFVARWRGKNERDPDIGRFRLLAQSQREMGLLENRWSLQRAAAR